MVIEELDADSLNSAVAAETGLVLIDFWSPFCVPCRGLRRHVERLADKYGAECRFVAIDVEKHADAIAAFDISSVPTLLLYRGGNVVTRFDGAVLPSDIATVLDKVTAA